MVAVNCGALTAHVAAAMAAWPSLAVDAAAYQVWLATALTADDAPAIASLVPGEVVLCWAAGQGDAEATRLIDAHYVQRLGPGLDRVLGGDATLDELRQRVRVKLLVAPAPGAPVPIGRYALGGNLAGLLRVAALREAVSLRRRARPHEAIDDHAELPAEHDPALRLLKQRYAAEFRDAFVTAARALPARDRHLLRLSLSVGASIDDLARMYGTHRATAARWLTAARDALAEGTRARLQAALRLGDDELQSLLRLVRTEATRLLESIPPDDAEA